MRLVRLGFQNLPNTSCSISSLTIYFFPGQYIELECSLGGVGDLSLVKEFKSFQKTEATWASLDADKRGLLFKRFLKRIKPSDPAASLTSDGLRAVKAPKKGSGKKPGQKNSKRANRTRTNS